MTYEDFFSATDVATFKRVKKGQMRLAGVCRGVVADMLGGKIATVGPEFITTNVGVYRVAMSFNSDNNLERSAHDQMGATTVTIESDEEMQDLFQRHGLVPEDAIIVFKSIVKRRLGDEA